MSTIIHPSAANVECKNCKAEITSKYCPECGQPATLHRIDRHYIFHEIEHVLHFERGIFYTIRGLLIKPGDSVKYFFTENRSRLVKPIIFIIITSLIYTIITHLFHLEDGYMKLDGGKLPVTTAIFKWITDHYGYSNILLGVFIALWLKLFFKAYDYNFYEALILLCFTMGMAMLIYAVFALFKGVTHIDLMQIGGAIGIGYCIWAIGQFFDKRKASSYVKAFFVYMLGMATFTIVVAVIGVALDIITRH